MKRFLTLLSLGGLFAAASAQAQVDIYFTGSTAFRANVARSVEALFSKNGAILASVVTDNSDHTKANHITWIGTIPGLFGSQTVNIHAAYSGSVAGIQSLTSGSPVTGFLYYSGGATSTNAHTADLAFSDVFQASTTYTSPALDDMNVAVQPFTYTKSVNAPVGLNNITIWQAAAMLKGGVMPLSFFTGSSADNNTLVYLTGRDNSSGTRLTAELDCKFIGDERIWAPDGSCNWTNFPSGMGFTSGSGVVGVLSGTCGAAIGYVGLADAKNVNGGLNILSYDGVMPFLGSIGAPDFTPVIMGQYSFWSYEHLFANTGASANVKNFRTALASEINLDLATSTTALQVSAMKVSRQADGGPITP